MHLMCVCEGDNGVIAPGLAVGLEIGHKVCDVFVTIVSYDFL